MIPADALAGLGPATIVRGDARHLPLADNSVDLIVTSPPYFALRSYQDGGEHYGGQIGSETTPQEFIDALIECTREMMRVLKPSGSIWVNLGDSYASSGGAGRQGRGGQMSERGIVEARVTRAADRTIPAKSLRGLPWRYALRCIDDLGLILRRDQIWWKTNGLPESVTDRTRSEHEYWFHLVQQPRYFAAVDEIREPHQGITRPNFDGTRGLLPKASIPGQSEQRDRAGNNPLGKLPGSVREVASQPLKVPDWLGVDHFAAFPPAWPSWIIRGWSPSGICTECEEGRRPIADRSEPIVLDGNYKATETTAHYENGQRHGLQGSTLGRQRLHQITGYACACPTPDAPTRPAVVLDPFGGTGTTAMSARALGRHGISVDYSADYCRLARWRCGDMDELAAVRGLPREQRATRPEQGSLLDLIEEAG